MKKIFIVFVTSVFALASCSDWTKPGALDYTHKTFEDSDPSGYAAYLESVGNYKNTDHKVVILNMKGTDAYPVSQSQVLMAMPDSADFICVNNLENLHPEFVKQIPLVKEKKVLPFYLPLTFQLRMPIISTIKSCLRTMESLHLL